MRINKVCCYRARVYNLLPCLLLTPVPGGFRLALKLWTGHLGIEVMYD